MGQPLPGPSLTSRPLTLGVRLPPFLPSLPFGKVRSSRAQLAELLQDWRDSGLPLTFVPCYAEIGRLSDSSDQPRKKKKSRLPGGAEMPSVHRSSGYLFFTSSQDLGPREGRRGGCQSFLFFPSHALGGLQRVLCRAGSKKSKWLKQRYAPSSEPRPADAARLSQRRAQPRLEGTFQALF